MNLFETLKKFKSIDPDASYAEKSRRMILASPQNEPQRARQIFVRIFETAGSLALAGALIFVIVGGFSSSRYFSPVSFQGIDPAALHAEAQAIDMQINIADLSYEQSSNEGGSTPMIATSSPAGKLVPAIVPSLLGAPLGATSTSSAASRAATSTASSTTFSINEALQQLEQ
jgi:hypothetical protein